MPDIQSALQQALSATPKPLVQLLDEWENESKPETTMTKTPTPIAPRMSAMSVSEQTFNIIRDNPYINVNDAVKRLVSTGCLATTTASLISQMVSSGMVSRDKDNNLSALQKKYTPIQSMPARADRQARALAAMGRTVKRKPYMIDVRAIKDPASAGIATLSATHAQATPTAAPKLLTAAQVIETLSVKEAHLLYGELRSMFGGL